MTPTQRTDMETALHRAADAITRAEGMAPAGMATQWAQLARVELDRAAAILAASDTTTTTTDR